MAPETPIPAAHAPSSSLHKSVDTTPNFRVLWVGSQIPTQNVCVLTYPRSLYHVPFKKLIT